MNTLSIDIETYSSNDLFSGGVYKYVEAEDFEILLFAYSVDGNPVEIVDLARGEKLPTEINHALTDPSVTKTAYNAQFERVCIGKYFLKVLLADQWECTMVKAATLGLPMGLDAVGNALKLDVKKDRAGKDLIKYFSVPCKPTKTNGGRTRNLPEHDIEKWKAFKAYCVKDVQVELGIKEKIDPYEVTPTERRLYELDQTINDRGIRLDMDLVKNAIRIDTVYSDALLQKATELTGLENPNSATQLRHWISEKEGIAVPSLNKTVIPELLETVESEEVKEVIELRQLMSKTSIKKYAAMVKCRCKDGRAHGLLQFYGASRTGRWSGRLIQIQNLRQIGVPDIDIARECVKAGDSDMLELLYDNVPDMLSQLIRTAFVASKGNRLIVADFTQIEAIVIAWLAGEQWIIEEYQGEQKLYEKAASRMMGIPVEEITKGSPARQKGKIASLACQYGGGTGALISMGALRMGLTEDELPEIISRWRKANRKITGFWSRLENAAKEAIEEPGISVSVRKGIAFKRQKGILFMHLPSGRKLAYLQPELRPNRFGSMGITYMSANQTTKRWERTDTYGGKLAENATQAVARDLLAEAMLRLENASYPVVAHVHDENIMDVPEGFGSLDEALKIMTETPKWAKGLPISADGFESTFYKK